MKFSGIYRFIAEKIRRIIFAKEIRELERAEAAARRKTTIAVIVCVVISVIAATAAVCVYLYFKNEQFNAKVNEIIAKIKSKLPFCSKAEELCEEDFDGDVIVEELEAEE